MLADLFFIHKAHEMKQNLDKSNCIQPFHNNSRVRSRYWAFNLSSHTWEFNLSHMPNPLNTNRIK